jgi:hypothetical protein
MHSKRALYKLADPFLSLWFSLVAPQRSALAQLPRAGRLRLLAAWENLCRRAVPKGRPTLARVLERAPQFDVSVACLGGKLKAARQLP